MVNKNKQKGYRYEKMLTDYFKELGFNDVRRVVLQGGYDQGDIHIGNDIVIQAKDCKHMSINKWIQDVHTQARNAGRLYPLLCIKTRQDNVKNSLTVMRLNTLTHLLQRVNINENYSINTITIGG